MTQRKGTWCDKGLFPSVWVLWENIVVTLNVSYNAGSPESPIYGQASISAVHVHANEYQDHLFNFSEVKNKNS